MPPAVVAAPEPKKTIFNASQGTKRLLIALLGIGGTFLCIIVTAIFGTHEQMTALTGPLGVFAGLVAGIYTAGSWHDKNVRKELIRALPEGGGTIESAETKDSTVIEKDATPTAGAPGTLVVPASASLGL